MTDWQKKYQTCEENLSTLKKLAHKATSDYDDLLKKYDQNQKQYENIKQLLIQREKELEELKQAVEPVCQQYIDMEQEMEVERECRNAAEVYATQVVKQNNNLKRQSQMLLDKVADKFELSDLKDIVEVEEVEENNKLDYYIQTIANLRNQLEDTQKSYAEEKALREKYDKLYNEQRSQYKSLHRVSMLALKDYENLQTKFTIERTLRDETEGILIKTKSEGEALKRQSQALLQSAASDQRLMKALMDIEQLKVETDRKIADRDKRIKELEEDLKKSEQEKMIADLECRLSTASDEVDRMQRQIKNLQQDLSETQESKHKLEQEMHKVKSKLDEAEEKLKPPPPPLPPPLPPPEAFTKKFIKSGRQTVPARHKDTIKQNPTYQKALDEMMQRIKSGTLHSSRGRTRDNVTNSENNKGIAELQKVLNVMKVKSKNLDTISAPGNLESGESELERAFKTRNIPSQQLSRIDENPGSEADTLLPPYRKSLSQDSILVNCQPQAGSSILRKSAGHQGANKAPATPTNSSVVRRSAPARSNRPNSQVYNTKM